MLRNNYLIGILIDFIFFVAVIGFILGLIAIVVSLAMLLLMGFGIVSHA